MIAMFSQPAPISVSGGPSRRTTRAVFVVAALLLAVQISPWYYFQGDAPCYISIARHLAAGHGFRNMDSPVLWYPPGYSIVIGPLFYIDRLPLLEISLLHWCLAVVMMFGVYLWARRFAPSGALWIAAISVGTNAVWIHYRRPVSELAFMTTSIWTVAFLEQAVLATRWKKMVGYVLLAMLLIGLSCLIRSLGIALAAGVGMRLLMAAVRKEITWSRATAIAIPIVAIGVAAVLGVVLRDHFVAASLDKETYLNNVAAHRTSGLVDSAWPWFAVVFTEVGRVSIPGMYKAYGEIGAWLNHNMLVYVPFGLALVYGWTLWVRRCDDALAWMLPFYLAVLTYFRWESGARYWVPMTPVIAACGWYLFDWMGRYRERLYALLWLLHVAAALMFWIARDMPHARAADRLWPAARAVAEQISVDRDQVCVAEECKELGYLLSLELDRRVAERPKETGLIPPQTRWLVLPEKFELPGGFVVCGHVKEYVVLKRSGFGRPDS